MPSVSCLCIALSLEVLSDNRLFSFPAKVPSQSRGAPLLLAEDTATRLWYLPATHL